LHDKRSTSKTFSNSLIGSKPVGVLGKASHIGGISNMLFLKNENFVSFPLPITVAATAFKRLFLSLFFHNCSVKGAHLAFQNV